MNNLFDRLVGVLGSHIESPAFRQFLEDIGEMPHSLPPPAPPMYFFNDAGFMLLTREAYITEVSAVTRNSTDHEDDEFGGLPPGISNDDTRIDVRRKLGMKPAGTGQNRKTGDIIDHYRISGVIVSFFFDKDNQQLTKVRMRLSSKQ